MEELLEALRVTELAQDAELLLVREDLTLGQGLELRPGRGLQ